MDKNMFWRVIDEVNSKVAATDLEAVLEVTKDKLCCEFSQQEIAQWVNYQYYYKDLADTSGVFAAACCLNDYMSDDGFTDFRMWLISRGREVYMAALKSPDSLAALDTPKNTTRFELYGYIGIDAYDAWDMHGDVYEERNENPISKEEKAAMWAEIEYFPHEVTGKNAVEHLPRMCARYLKPGALLNFSYSPLFNLAQSVQEDTVALERLKKAVLSVEGITGSRFVYVNGGPSINQGPKSPLVFTMHTAKDASARLFHMRFDANLWKAGEPMDSAGLARLKWEVGEAHTLLLALEREPCALTPVELKQFGDFIKDRQVQQQPEWQEDDPDMEQTM